MNNPNEHDDADMAFRTFANADLNRYIHWFRRQDPAYFQIPENRNRIFRSGLVEVIRFLDITQFTRDDLVTTIQAYKTDCLRYMLSLQPGRIRELHLTQEAYIHATRPPLGTLQGDIFTMFKYLYSVLGPPTPTIIGLWIFNRTLSLPIEDGFEPFQAPLIADILALYIHNCEDLTPNDLQTLVSFDKFTPTLYIRDNWENILYDIILKDDETYINIIRDYVTQMDVLADFDGDEYIPLREILMSICMRARTNILRRIISVFICHAVNPIEWVFAQLYDQELINEEIREILRVHLTRWGSRNLADLLRNVIENGAAVLSGSDAGFIDDGYDAFDGLPPRSSEPGSSEAGSSDRVQRIRWIP
jgi:hypothetical protein